MTVSIDQVGYKKKYAEYTNERACVQQDRWRLKYHIMPESGWLNDPNGLCQFQGTYHIYYQYSPFDVTGKMKLWGHVTTKDFITWTQEEPILFPDHKRDAHGVYSGSAFIENDTIYYYYTGNVKLYDRSDYDYTYHGREQNTLLVSSKDGYHISDKQVILTNADYPDDMSCHVRDPKLYKKNDTYYMVLGARDCTDRGCVLVYKSKNLHDWTYVNRLYGAEPFGYMWECPDVFDLDGQTVLLTCPQGVKAKGYDYQNVYQSGYFLVEGDISSSYTLQPFHQLDRGFDFYAPQTFLDENGRRILIGWMGLPDIPYENPTVAKGWEHALTIPRILYIKDGRIHQEPIKELQQLRKKSIRCCVADVKTYKILERIYECLIDISSEDDFTLQLRNSVELAYSVSTHTLSLVMKENGYGRDTRSVKLEKLKNLQIFSDSSSLEIFVNDGEEVFTTRVYEVEEIAPLAFSNCKMQGTVVWYELDGFTIG